MAITIRNKRTEALIHAIGAETGEGPSRLIARWANEAEAERLSARAVETTARATKLREFLATTPPVSDEDRRAVWQDLEEMYDADGLPR